MSIRKQATRGGVVALGISLVAVLAFAWGQVNPDGAQADADGPAMSLGAPGTVFMGVTFQVTVTADPAPDEDIAGLGSEVVWIESDASGAIIPDTEITPDGLKWQPRADCFDELQVERADGGAIALCNSFVPILTGGVAHAVLSQFQQDAAALDVAPGSTTLLLELDFVCNTASTYTLILTAVPDSPDGALFGAPSGAEIAVKTVEQDYDGDTTPNNVADTLTIECSDEPPPTDTPEPTDIPPTDVPPTDVPPATDTPVPTLPIGAVSAGFGPFDGDGGVSAGLWAVIGAMLAAAATGLIILGWPKQSYATVSAGIATPAPAFPATSQAGTGSDFGLWPIVGAVAATGLALFGWKITRRGR